MNGWTASGLWHQSSSRANSPTKSWYYGVEATHTYNTGGVNSGFLTSPTFGGLSWLAHSTLQSGVHVDGEQRYDELVENNRVTLTRAFKRARWRAVAKTATARPLWRAIRRKEAPRAVLERWSDVAAMRRTPAMRAWKHADGAVSAPHLRAANAAVRRHGPRFSSRTDDLRILRA